MLSAKFVSKLAKSLQLSYGRSAKVMCASVLSKMIGYYGLHQQHAFILARKRVLQFCLSHWTCAPALICVRRPFRSCSIGSMKMARLGQFYRSAYLRHWKILATSCAGYMPLSQCGNANGRIFGTSYKSLMAHLKLIRLISPILERQQVEWMSVPMLSPQMRQSASLISCA